MLRKVILLTLTAACTLTLIAGCGNKTEAEKAGSASSAASGPSPASGLTTGPNVGNLAPDFKLQRIDGGTIELSSLKGKAVIIDFWDTWCPPCKRAMPTLQQLSEAYAGDLVIVGVAMGRDGVAKVRSFVEQNHLTFEFALADAPQYKVLRDYGGVQSIPTTFLLDRDGVIRNVWTGEMPHATYESAIRAALGV